MIGLKGTLQILFHEYNNWLMTNQTYNFMSSVSKEVLFSLFTVKNTAFVFKFTLFRLLEPTVVRSIVADHVD